MGRRLTLHAAADTKETSKSRRFSPRDDPVRAVRSRGRADGSRPAVIAVLILLTFSKEPTASGLAERESFGAVSKGPAANELKYGVK
ncbi:MAG: hypothetical protein J0G33_12945 [Afipia felis]|nr:hypothetical protein [Afipia felis]